MQLSLFNPEHTAQFVQRLTNLSGTSVPVFGTMTCSQMLLHCSKVILFAAGEIPVTSNKQFPDAFYRKAKLRLCSDQQLEQNLPAFDEVTVPSGNYDFESERSGLIALLARINNERTNFYRNNRHPYFGEMSHADWDRLQVKHLRHHLSQFGV